MSDEVSTERTLLEHLAASRILAVLRRPDIATCADALVTGLRERGVRAIECTLDQPGALEVIRRLRAERLPDELIGAGTVRTTLQIDALHAAGADFAVSPHLDEALLAYAVEVGLPLLPGVMTPSEVARALALGAPAVKLFPAGPLGIDYLKALRGPFPDVAVVPTGGIAIKDVRAWLQAGALCVGLGSALTRGDRLPETLTSVLAQP